MNRIKRIVGASVGAFLFVTILNAAHATGMRALFTLDIAEEMALACEMFSEQKGYRSEWHLPGLFWGHREYERALGRAMQSGRLG